MNFEYSPYILPLIAAALVSVIVAIYAWIRRSANGAFVLFLMAAAIFEWTIGYSLEIAGADLVTKYLWGVIQYIGIAFVPYGWLLFSIIYSDQARIISRRFIILTALIPFITVLLALTTKWHGLIWSEYHINQQGEFSAIEVSYGLWFWVHFVYSYIILLIGTILLARVLWRRRGMYRGQIVALLVAVLTPWIGNALYLTGNSPIPYLDLTPFAFTVTVAALAWAIFGFHLVDITPLARDRVVDSMPEGMIVLDVRGNIVDINNAAARMIGVPVANALGKTAVDVFSPWSHLVERFQNVMEAKDEISVGVGEAKRRYEVRLSPLQDPQGQFVGRVIMLRAMDDEVPQPRFARSLESKSDTRSQVRVEMAETEFEDRAAKKQIPILGMLVNFYNVPIKKDLPIPNNINPDWHRVRERLFTTILRFGATVRSVSLLFSVLTASKLGSQQLVFGIMIIFLWVLGWVRSIKYEFRVSMFLALIYGFGFVEILNYGFTMQSTIFLMIFVIISAVLLSRQRALYALATAVVTRGVFTALIGSKVFIPIGSTYSPNFVNTEVMDLLIFTVGTSAIFVFIVMLVENLNNAWQKETQALNLLQQERDLLEQRVERRTREVAMARDEAEKNSNELRKYYRAIEQSGNSIVITDLKGNIEYVNPRFEQSTGYSIAEIKGKRTSILKSGRHSVEEYNQLWETISEGNIWNGDLLNKRKDGSLYWESTTIAPVLNQDGAITNYVAVKEDITVRRQTEEQLRKLTRAVEQSGNTVIVMDDNGLIEYVNPKFTEVTGYSSEEALGKSPISLMNGLGGIPDFSQHEWWLTVNSGRIWHGEFQNHRKDGTVFWESATIAPVHNLDGEVTNFVEIKQDITEQKILQDQLQKQNDYLSILHQITLDLLNRREINDLLQVIVDRSAVLLDAPFSELMLEEDGFLVVESFTDNQLSMKGDRATREQAKLSWQAFDTHQPVVLEDYAVWEHRREIYNSQSLHATADFPVMVGNRCLGVLALGRSQPNYQFTTEQIETGILFARLVALVLDNANLYESAMTEIAERKRMEQALFNQYQYLSALHKTTFELLQSRDVASLLRKIAIQASELVEAQYGDIYLSEEDDLVLRAATANASSVIGSREKKSSFGILGEVWQNMRPFVVENYNEWEKRNPLYVKENLRAVAGIPIIGREGPLGVLEVARMDDDERNFTPLEIEMIEQFSSLAALVLDNAQLYDQSQKELAERERTQALLQESEARFRQIVENASDIIYRTDMNGNFIYANPSALILMGFTSEQEVLGRNYIDLTTPEFRHKLKRVYDHQYISKTKSTYYEFPAVTVDGQIVWVGQNVQLIMDGGQVVGFQAVGRDVTQLKQAQEALALSRDQALDASLFKSQLLSRVSHELRTPLGGILGYAELLQYQAFGSLNEKQHNAITNVIESTNYLTIMVNDLLDESQIESNSLSLHNEYFNPVELLEKTKTTMSMLADKKGLTFRAEAAPDLPSELYGDVNRLRQVVINLAGNSIKFTKAGEVSVSFKRPTPAQWSIEVRDTGAGIPQSEHETIFEPFRQVNNSVTRENRGSGLGLAITKQLVEIMGGQISLESEVGKGSLFTIILPIKNAPGE